MSINVLLQPETADEVWSHLHCNKLTAKQIDVSGGLVRDVLDAADVVLTNGAGTVSNAGLRSIKENAQGKLVNYDMSFRIVGVAAPVNALGQSVFSLEIDTKDAIAYPDDASLQMLGSANALVSSLPGGLGPRQACGAILRRIAGEPSKVLINVVVAGNVSAPDALRTLELDVILKYEVA